jgi:hypothetical protein
VPASAPVFDSQAEDAALRQFEAQDAAVDDDDDDFGVPRPPPPPMPPRSHDHEAGSSSATLAAPPAIDPTIASILQSHSAAGSPGSRADPVIREDALDVSDHIGQAGFASAAATPGSG